MRASAILPAALLTAACSLLTACTPLRPIVLAEDATGARLHVAQLGWRQSGRGRPVEVVRVDEQPGNANEWEVVGLDPRSRRIRIQWADGPSAQCGRSDQALVQETERAVVIGLRSTDRGPAATCPAVAVARSRTIELTAPLGARALLEQTPPGVNADHSPVTGPGRLPVPVRCLHGSAERNVPVGAIDVADRMVPFVPTRALICSADPHVPQRVVTDSAALEALTRDLNAGTALPLDEHGLPRTRPDRSRSSYDLYVSDATAVVQVHVGDRGRLAMSNGIRTTAVPDDLSARLERLTTP